MKDVIILAKGESRRLCPFDAQEVWGVKDVCTFDIFLDKRFDRIFDFEPRPIHYMDKRKYINSVTRVKDIIPELEKEDSNENKILIVKNLKPVIKDKEITELVVFAKDGKQYKIGKHLKESWPMFQPGTILNIGYKPYPPIKITSFQPYADIKYPIQEILDKYGSKYFTNTISYMIALAMYEGFEKIRMYGVDAPFGGVYFLEKSGIEYWTGRAQQAGIKVEICEGSHVCRTKTGQLYGEKEDEGRIPLYMQERLILMNILPSKGDHDVCYISNMCKNILSLKEPEGKEHNVAIQMSPDGKMSYKCDHEFQTELWLPDYCWAYLKKRLITLESRGEMPVAALSIYEKLVGFCETENLGEPKMPNFKKSPMISYVLPTKDRPPFLKKAFEDNIRKLVTPMDELIVVDGSEGDGSKKIIDNNRDIIDVLIRETDTGPADAFNKGALVARGRYVKWLCDDDIVSKDGMEQAVGCMDKNPDIDLLVCSGIKKTALGSNQTYSPPDYGHDTKDVYRYGACGIGFVWRRSSLSKMGILESDHMIPDQEYVLRAISKGYNVKFLPVILYQHPILTHSTSIRDRKEWKRQEKALIKKYDGTLYYYWLTYVERPYHRFKQKIYRLRLL